MKNDSKVKKNNKFFDFINKNKEFPVALLMIVAVFLLIIIASRGFSTPPYSPVAIKIGTIEIAWYAIFILTGIIFAAIMALYESRKIGLSKSSLYDGILVIVPLSILGARLYYVLFDPNKANNYHSFIDVINITSGGLAIHGAIIVAFIGTIIFCKIKKVNFWAMADLLVIGFLIGQIIGRWGNFFNQEAHGGVLSTTSFMFKILPNFIKEQMYLHGPQGLNYYHPTFLYESGLNLIALVFFLIIRRFKVLKVGDTLAIYLMWYGLMRGLIIEPMRTDPLYIGGFGGVRVNILLSLVLLFGGGLILLIVKYSVPKLRKMPYYYDASREDIKRQQLVKEKIGNTKAVLFDLDGTILNSTKTIIKRYEVTFAKHFPEVELTKEDKLDFIGPTLYQTLSKYTDDKELIEEAISTYRKYATMQPRKDYAYSGVRQTFRKLMDLNIKIGIVTSKGREVAKMGLEQNKLMDYVDLIVGFEDVKEHKPHPESLEKALDILNLRSSEVIYVGDHENDVKAAKRLEIMVVGVSYSQRRDKLLAAGPDFMVDNIEEIINLL